MTPGLRHSALLAGAVFVTLTLISVFGPEPKQPRHDAIRYIDYIYHLAVFDTFGLGYGTSTGTPEPAAANAPLYPWLASNVLANPDRQTLACLLNTTPRNDCASPGTSCGPAATGAPCDLEFDRLMLLNLLLVGLSLWLCGVLAYGLTGKYGYFYLTPLFALLAFEQTDYGQRILVGNLVIPLFISLQIALLWLIRKPTLKGGFVVGLITGLLALTRPEYVYLVPLLMIVVLLTTRSFRCNAVLLLAFAITLSPWLWRNQLQFNQPTIIVSEYGSHVAAERVALNALSWSEWLISFVYWFPDSGDKLARYWFGEEATSIFDNSSPNTIYRAPTLEQLEQSAFSILQKGVLESPAKHVAVTAALAWRGIFIGKYWGVIALIGLALLLRQEWQSGRREIFWLLSLPLFMLLLRAGVSLNVPRYNVPMIGLLAMGWTYLLMRVRLPFSKRVIA